MIPHVAQQKLLAIKAPRDKKQLTGLKGSISLLPHLGLVVRKEKRTPRLYPAASFLLEEDDWADLLVLQNEGVFISQQGIAKMHFLTRD
jgi:hypothetical protein